MALEAALQDFAAVRRGLLHVMYQFDTPTAAGRQQNNPTTLLHLHMQSFGAAKSGTYHVKVLLTVCSILNSSQYAQTN